MSNIIKHGFSIKSEVLEISSIKPGGSGSMNGNDYPASTKFRTLNMYEEPFEGTVKEVEEIIEYQIPCSSNEEAANVTKLLRGFRAKKQPVFISTAIPKLYPNSQIYTAKSLELGHIFLENNGFKPEADKK